MKKRSSSIVPIALFVTTFVAFMFIHEVRLQPDGATHLSFLDVGQGDSTLIRTPSGKTVIIDGGPDLTTLEAIGSRMPFFKRTIDLLILSHPNQDHLAAFPELLKRYDVKRMLLSNTPYALPRYAAILELLRERGTDVIFAAPGEHLTFGDGLAFDVVWPAPGFAYSDVNDVSVTVRVHDAHHSALFTGDMEERAERAILQTHQLIDSDILKVAHHGSKTSSGTGFILAVSPTLAVISVGADNTYGHPSPSILKRYEYLKIPIWRTDLQGTMEVSWK